MARQTLSNRQTLAAQTLTPSGDDGVAIGVNDIMHARKVFVTLGMSGGAGVAELWGKTVATGGGRWGRIMLLNGGLAFNDGDARHQLVDNAGGYARLALVVGPPPDGPPGTPVWDCTVADLLENTLRGD